MVVQSQRNPRSFLGLYRCNSRTASSCRQGVPPWSRSPPSLMRRATMPFLSRMTSVADAPGSLLEAIAYASRMKWAA